MSGAFITFEGGEGAGKSTQIRRLAEWFEARGIGVTRTREPGGTPLAEAIRALILGRAPGHDDALTEALLFAAARRENIRAVIAPALAAGGVVLCDRFTDSTRAYQGGRLPAAMIEASITLATGGLSPDLTILIDLPPAEGLARARARRGALAGDAYESADLAFHEAVRERFRALAAGEPKRFLVVDGAAREEDVASAIATGLAARLPWLGAGAR